MFYMVEKKILMRIKFVTKFFNMLQSIFLCTPFKTTRLQGKIQKRMSFCFFVFFLYNFNSKGKAE